MEMLLAMKHFHVDGGKLISKLELFILFFLVSGNLWLEDREPLQMTSIVLCLYSFIKTYKLAIFLMLLIRHLLEVDLK